MKYVLDSSVAFKTVVAELVTADAKLVLALGKQFPFIVELSTFP